MPATYTPISLPEMLAVLRPEKGWYRIRQHRELVFVNDKALLSMRCRVKVYSSLSAASGTCRDSGEDAIRIAVVTDDEEKAVTRSAKILRVAGWAGRIQERVMEKITEARHSYAARAYAAQPGVRDDLIGMRIAEADPTAGMEEADPEANLTQDARGRRERERNDDPDFHWSDDRANRTLDHLDSE